MKRTAIAAPRALALGLIVACASAVSARADHGAADAAVVQAAPPPSDPAADQLSDETFELEYEEPAGFPDPLEPANRRIFWFDQQLSRWVIDPVTKTYQFIVPDPVRRCVRRFFLNVNSPSVLINDLLQREWGDASITIQRFALNTTIGIGGLFDPAAPLGLERHNSDFGQTLALIGVGSGPYIVLPFFGPNTARDTVGDVVDFFFQPTLYFLPVAQLIIYEGSFGLSARDTYAEALAALESSSVDYYSALHNAYYQNRMAEIWGRREAHRLAAAAANETTQMNTEDH
jgi:phospholipid-binding lipoprotein MlaA